MYDRGALPRRGKISQKPRDNVDPDVEMTYAITFKWSEMNNLRRIAQSRETTVHELIRSCILNDLGRLR